MAHLFWMVCNADKMPRNVSRQSTLDARWSVRKTYSPTDKSCASKMRDSSALPANENRVSIITLPTKWMRLSSMFSRLRLSHACVEGANNKSDMASTINRLISSGIDLSPLRNPASMCATGICNFAASIAQARVELTSPTTTTQSGLSADKTSSNSIMICAV